MNNINKDLFEKMLDNPLDFNSIDFKSLTDAYILPNGKYNVEEAFKDFRECIKLIYNLNEESLKETSNANQGILGRLNKRTTDIRKEEYYKRVEEQKPGKNYVKIYAEGDSWFLFPILIKDIIDWLEENKNYLILSDAYAGDWITNIIYEGQYIHALSAHSPDVFLISGGGNDLVGNERLGIMVNGRGKENKKHTQESISHIEDKEQSRLILLAQEYITKNFYAFIWIMKAQYYILFKGIYHNTNKFSHMISITQGYDYPIPRNSNNHPWAHPTQAIINQLGEWLFRPLMINGILDKEIQRAITMTFIYEYNEMLIDLNKEFDNVYHIDCRGTAKSEDDWYDELHLTSDKYKIIAERFKELIEEKIHNKVH